MLGSLLDGRKKEKAFDMKYFVLLFLLPLLAVGQNQNQATNIFGDKHFPKAKILLKDSSHVYFKKTAQADSVFKIPASEVKAKLKGVPIADYDDMNDALLQFNTENSLGHWRVRKSLRENSRSSR